MTSDSRPLWQQASALVSLGVGGAVTAFHFVPQAAADVTSPESMPAHLLAYDRVRRVRYNLMNA